MPIKRKAAPVFKDYDPQQMMMLPPLLTELIAAHDPSRVVNDVVDKIDLQPLLQAYTGGGCSSYHPKMLLKVVVYGYMTNVYSSRKLEEACRSNICFMWLAAMNTPELVPVFKKLDAILAVNKLPVGLEQQIFIALSHLFALPFSIRDYQILNIHILHFYCCLNWFSHFTERIC